MAARAGLRDATVEAFCQADGTTNRRFGGTGLGLALIRRLCDAMDGQLSLQSGPGQGSVFQVDLPLPAHAAPPRAVPLNGEVTAFCEADSGLARLIEQQLPCWGLRYRRLDPQQLDSVDAEGVLIVQEPAGLAVLRERFPGRPLLLVTRWSEFLGPQERTALAPLEQLALPLTRAELYQALRRLHGLAAEDAAGDARGPEARRPPRVLLVEDNPVNQLVARGMLERLGCRVATVADGAEALEHLEHEEVDLVLMDCNMPSMDGYEATRRLRLQPKLQQLPVIALTANVLSDERARCVAAGMNDYLAKPFSREALAELLGRWLPANCGLCADG